MAAPVGEDSPKTASRPKAVSVDLTEDNNLVIIISDAFSTKNMVRFKVHTKTTMKAFKEAEFSVIREHEEFLWLHDLLLKNEDLAGFIIPPPPPRPDFDEPRAKLARLREGEDEMSKEEYTERKEELETEYLAIFKKTVAMHEIFLQRLAAHPTLRDEYHLQTFLEFDGDLRVRSMNAKEALGNLFKSMSKSVDVNILLKNHKEVDSWFEDEKQFLIEYNTRVRDATKSSEKTSLIHKRLADSYIGVAACISLLPLSSNDPMSGLYRETADAFHEIRSLEGRVATDEDLKLCGLLRYYWRDSQAALDLLYRRTKSLANLESANKKLEQSKLKNKGVTEAEAYQKLCNERYNRLSESGKEELQSFKTWRVAAFKKNLVEMAELHLQHAKDELNILRATVAVLKSL